MLISVIVGNKGNSLSLNNAPKHPPIATHKFINHYPPTSTPTSQHFNGSAHSYTMSCASPILNSIAVIVGVEYEMNANKKCHLFLKVDDLGAHRAIMGEK